MSPCSDQCSNSFLSVDSKPKRLANANNRYPYLLRSASKSKYIVIPEKTYDLLGNIWTKNVISLKKD